MEEKKKSNNIIIVILVLIIIAALGVIAYLLIDNGVFDKNSSKVKENGTEGNKKVVETKLTEQEAVDKGKILYDKATEIYEMMVLLPYCGHSHKEVRSQDFKSKLIKFPADTYAQNSFYDSGYKNLDELKSALKKWLSEDIVNSKYPSDTKVVTDVNELSKEGSEYYNYLIYDGKLYCGTNTGKGWVTLYLNKYDLSVKTIEMDKITFTAKLYFAKDINSTCAGLLEYDKCSSEEIETKDTEFVIIKENNNWVVSSYKLHDFDN